MNSRNQLILAYIPLLTFAGVSQISSQTTRKPMNVLFIASDDLNLDMNAFGNPDVKTPNLDRLAKMGTVFTRAYNQCPLSGPSRASLMTGYRPDKIGVFDLEGMFRNAKPDAVTLPELFKKNGYYTCRIGKIFHAGVPSEIGLPGPDDPQSWSITYNPVGIDKTGEGDLTGNVTLGTYLAIDGTDNEFTDAISANLAGYLLKSRYGRIGSAYGGPARPNAPSRNQTQPFFMAVGFYRPHIPYIAPKKYFDMYPTKQLKLPEASEEEWKNKPGLARTVVPINAGQSEEECLKTLQAYYASVTFVDAQIGKLIDVLEELDLINNTIIVFWSDHGYMLGHHGLWQKQNLFEHTASQPLLIYAPGFTGGKPSNKIVELIDIYPTVTQIAGLKPPTDLDGKSLVPILENPDVKWDYPAFTTQARTLTQNSNMRMPGGSAEFTFNPSISDKTTTVFGRSVRVDRYRYTEWDEGRRGEELYDYESDPEERNNLAGDNKFRKTQEELKSMLRSSYNNEEIVKTNEIIKKNKEASLKGNKIDYPAWML